MAKRYVHVITVTGALPFPVDMLRYDRCTPNAETDSAVITRSLNDPMSGALTVQVQTDGRPRHWYPTAGRWESFGWKITDVVTREDYA